MFLENAHEKSRKVMENHFQFSVCTLFSFYQTVTFCYSTMFIMFPLMIVKDGECSSPLPIRRSDDDDDDDASRRASGPMPNASAIFVIK